MCHQLHEQIHDTASMAVGECIEDSDLTHPEVWHSSWDAIVPKASLISSMMGT